MSTIGFGDIVPGAGITATTGDEEIIGLGGGVKVEFILCSLYILIGMAVIAMCFNLMQQKVIEGVRSFGKKIGILKDESTENIPASAAGSGKGRWQCGAKIWWPRKSSKIQPGRNQYDIILLTIHCTLLGYYCMHLSQYSCDCACTLNIPYRKDYHKKTFAFWIPLSFEINLSFANYILAKDVIMMVM